MTFLFLIHTTSDLGRVSDECVISKGPLHFEGRNTQHSKWVNTLKQKHSNIFAKQSFSLSPSYTPIVSYFCFLLRSHAPAFSHIGFTIFNFHAFSPFFHLVPLVRLSLDFFPALLLLWLPLLSFSFMSSSLFLSFLPPPSPHAADNWTVMRW